ncbi:VOC family protein [Caldibacillus lycopersici]|uniref:VOC family protein n=1 Tax=Perspicuibacillus lycopersici TaxID=1325689 RepID=A0AAE3LPC0_9BACI|nr:VOC family protein [Perspicuibacillus lycopersici]MCU9614787.1 VOC family protein [Perspicuibacillus lycopersici]
MGENIRGLIHHIEINVSDINKSTAFWGWLLEELGYILFQQWEKGRSWKLADSYIVFVETEARYLDVPYHRRRTGLNHLAFYASSREHVDQLTAQLKEKRIPILYADNHPFAGGKHHYAVFFEDPDRIKVELVAPNE